MKLIAAYCLDAPDMSETRRKTRPAHLEFLRRLGTRIKLAGPLMDDACEKPIGSFLILEAESLGDAKSVLAGDPYAQAGLFRSVSLSPWRGVLGEWWERP